MNKAPWQQRTCTRHVCKVNRDLYVEGRNDKEEKKELIPFIRKIKIQNTYRVDNRKALKTSLISKLFIRILIYQARKKKRQRGQRGRIHVRNQVARSAKNHRNRGDVAVYFYLGFTLVGWVLIL
jgi:hypothetical protein